MPVRASAALLVAVLLLISAQCRPAKESQESVNSTDAAAPATRPSRARVKPIGSAGVELTTPFSRIRLTEEGSVRSLYFIGDSGQAVLETRIDLARPEELESGYTQTMFASYLFHPVPQRVLLVGLGAGAMVRFLQHHQPGLEIDAIDIDPEMPRLAADYFGTRPDEKRRFIVADGYDFIRTGEQLYDVIYMDAFLKPSEEADRTGVPLNLKEATFYQATQERLRPGGVVIFNLHHHFGVNDDLESIQSAFPQTYRFKVADQPQSIVVGASEAQRLSPLHLQAAGKLLDERFKTTFSFDAIAHSLQPHGQLPIEIKRGEMAATLNEAIASQPPWLQGWVMILVIAHLLALAFVVHRTDKGWRVRGEPIAILVSFVAAALLMTWLFDQFGYVRLLGLAHLVLWTPVYVWILRRRKEIGTNSLFGRYLLLYLAIAGISLIVDTMDVARYLAG